MSIRRLLVLSAAALVLSTLRSHAGPCSLDIHRGWAEVMTRIQARVGTGGSAPQSITALLHHQPTPDSVAAAKEKIVEGWLPMEAAVAALARAREADHVNDKRACDQALAEAQRAIVR
jgi:hypothetical protein